MNWLNRLFGGIGIIIGELLFPQSVADGTIPPGVTPDYGQPHVAVTPGGGFQVVNEKGDPMTYAYAIPAVVVALLLIGGK